jgi:hypothetical protein
MDAVEQQVRDAPPPARTATGDHPGGAASPAAGTGDARSPFVSRRELLFVSAAALLLTLLVLRPWPLDVPVSYRGDVFQHLSLIEASNWLGDPGATSELNAPHGLDWSVMPTGTERLQLAVQSVLDAVTGSPVAAMNLYAVLALVATALVAHHVLRRLGCGALVAGLTSLVFALSPAAIGRLDVGHLFLFALYPVPLLVYAVHWSTHQHGRSDDRSDGRGSVPRKWWAPVLAVVAIALSSVYAAAFAALVIASVAVVRAVRAGSAQVLVAPSILTAVLVVAVGLTVAPDHLATRDDPAASSWSRTVSDSDTYGLRIAPMLLPSPDHPLGPLASWGERAVRAKAPVDRTSSLGTVGTLGLALGAAVMLRRVGRRRDRTDERIIELGTINAVVLALATVGGGGFILATLGITQIRGWSRMSTIVLFCSLATLAVWAQGRHRSNPRYGAAVVAVAILALAEGGLVLPNRSAIERAVAEDEHVVAELESALPEGAFVAQLPVVSFPDDLGSGRLLAPSVHSDGHLRFTAANFRGGAGDWQESWLAHEPERAVRAAAAAGAHALLLQRNHPLVADADALEAELEAAAGVPGQRTATTWTWFDLRPLHQELTREHGSDEVRRVGAAVTRPIGVTYEGQAGRQRVEEQAATLLGPDAALVLHVAERTGGTARVRISLEGRRGAQVRVSGAAEPVTVATDGDVQIVELEVPLDRPIVRVGLRTSGGRLQVEGSDGEVGVRVRWVEVLDVRAADSDVLR